MGQAAGWGDVGLEGRAPFSLPPYSSQAFTEHLLCAMSTYCVPCTAPGTGKRRRTIW